MMGEGAATYPAAPVTQDEGLSAPDPGPEARQIALHLPGEDSVNAGTLFRVETGPGEER